jgi:hypothetical protein
MKKMLLLALLASQLVKLNGQNEINFHKSYYLSEGTSSPYTPYFTHTKKIIPDKINGGYFIVGRQEYTLNYNNFVNKIDAFGQHVWANLNNKQIRCDIEQMSNGELLLAGGRIYLPTHSPLGSGFRITVANSSYSSIVWEKEYTGTEGCCNAVAESFDTVTLLPDGVVGCGTTDVRYGNIMCVKANRSTGAIIWSKTYNFGGNLEVANDICQTEDGGYAITGYCDQYLVVFKLDGNGNLLWSQKMDIVPGSNAAGATILNAPDAGGYSILVGGNISGNTTKALVLKRDATGTMNLVISGLVNETTSLHSMEMRNGNAIMISGLISGTKTYISTLALSNIANTTLARYFDNFNSRSTAITTDNSFISIHAGPGGGNFDVFKTKSNGLVNCLGAEFVFPMTTQSYTNAVHSVTVTTNPYFTSYSPSTFPLIKQNDISCCYVADANIQTITVHAICHEPVELAANCEGESVKWFDQNDLLIPGNVTNVLSLVANQSTHRTARKYNASGCVVCEKRFEVIVDPPQVCFTLPEAICTNQPIVPQLTCDMSRINWHQWVVTELNGAWENRVVKGQFPSGGTPSAINIKTLWKGFIPGKCYGISLDVQDSCGNSNTQYQFFCIPAIEEDTLNLTMCPLNGNSTRWFEPSPHCSGAYYTFLGNDSRDYPYGYPLSPGSYVMDCFDAAGCQIKRLVVQVLPMTPLPITTCSKTIYFCELIPNPEGILPDCENCYRIDPRVELFPLEMETVNGSIHYKRKIIDWDNCRQCDFSFDIIDAACNFTPNFAYYASALHPEDITFSNISISAPGTVPCGSVWNMRDLATPITTVITGSAFNFTCIVGHTYEVCLTVTNCACGRECVKTICTTMFVGEEGPMRLSGEDGTAQLVSPAANETKLLTEIIVNPNPSSGKFTLLSSSRIAAYDRVVLMSTGGQTLFQLEKVPTDYEYVITDLAKGLYTIKVITGSEVKVMKLIIQ